jgi:hypothetical protein
MVKPSEEEGKSALQTALECAYELVLQKIISNPNDMLGILLFGTVEILKLRNLFARRRQKSKAITHISIISWIWMSPIVRVSST